MSPELLAREGRRLFTAREVLRMAELGFFEGQHVELIDGELRVVSPQGPPHMGAIGRLNRILSLAYGPDHTVRVQGPVEVPDGLSLPEPDLAVVVTEGPWSRRHADCAETLLVVEVAVSSLAVDRRKAALYAEAGAPVYWLVEVERGRVVVHEGPRPDGAWSVVDVRDPLVLPGIGREVPVAEILPREDAAG
ncbi:MAG: Uma2 family endonuclease [Actinomycetota bacterium]